MPDEHATEATGALFISLVMSLGTAAMQQMGHVPDPVSGKAAADLQAAQATIDLLAMLADKTRGNLSRQEETILRDTLSSLQMLYVQTCARPAPPAAAPPAADAGPATETPSPEPTPSADAQRRFHKSYS